MRIRRIRITKKPKISERPGPMAAKIIKKLKKGLVAKRKMHEKQSKNIFFFSDREVVKQPVTPQPTQVIAPSIVIKESHGVDIEIPKMPMPLIAPMSTEEKEMLRNVNISYPLIPKHPKRNQKVYAYARIVWDKDLSQLVYLVVEPHISSNEKKIIDDIKRELEERLDIDFMKLGEIRAKELLKEEIKNIISTMEGVDQRRLDVLQYYIERDIIGLGEIEPLMRDDEIEDISCDGVGIPIYIYHRNPLFGSMMSNVVFNNADELDTFVMKLSQKCGKSISVAEPMVEGSLPDGSRVHAVLGTDIARRGSNFTIRKFTRIPLTPIHMLEYGTLNSTQLAYLWLAIENRKSILISGGTATGKTSLLNALSLFIRPSMKIVSIEDTPELRLPHPHWVPEVARTPISEGKRTGEVSLFDLLKGSLRQRPDYIIVGEVRGKEAYVLFQQMATGHAGLATVHAASLPQLIDRLTTPPINLPPTLIQNLDVIVFLLNVRVKDRYVRRVHQIVEITGVKGDVPSTVEIFRWNPMGDKFETVGKSMVLEHIAKSLGITEASLKEEIRTRKRILEWMKEKKMFDYREVAKIINAYYSNPEKIIAMVEEEL